LRALGAANLAAGVFSGYPVTGGLSRTAVNYRAGARTSLASLISASFVLLTLAFLTPAFHYLPSAALAAIIIVAVAGMVDIQDAVRLFRIKSRDGWVLLATFAVTLGVGIEQGILAGIVLSLLFYIWQSSRPHTAELGYLAGRRAFLNVGRYPEAVRFEDVIILRVDSSLYFANMEFVGDILRRRIASRPDVRWVVLDFSGVNDMDAVAVLELEEIMEGYGEHGVRFLLARVKGPVRDVLDRAGWYQRRGGNIEYPNISSALKAVGSLRPLRGSVPEENLDE
jgi:SulP family sulfate permease